MSYTREDLEKMTIEEVKDLRDSHHARWYWGTRRQLTAEQEVERDAEWVLLCEFYEENRVVTPLEKEFRELMASDIPYQIEALMQKAYELMRQATALADEHGIPFSSGVSPLGQNYLPETSKFESLFVDEDLCEEFEIYSEDGWYGWEHSAVC